MYNNIYIHILYLTYQMFLPLRRGADELEGECDQKLRESIPGEITRFPADI